MAATQSQPKRNTRCNRYVRACRDRQKARLNRIARWVKAQSHPFRQVDIARALDIPYHAVRLLLPRLEDRGILLCEGPDRRLSVLKEMDYNEF